MGSRRCVMIETRIATSGDEAAIRRMLKRAARLPIQNWYWEDHLGQENFQLALAGGRPVGALLAWADVLPVAWVRLAVLMPAVTVGEWLDRSLPPILVALRRRGARWLGWMDAGGWAESALMSRGFHSQTRLVTLVKSDRLLPPLSAPEIEVRPVRPDDMADIARIDRAAFTPPWWLSGNTLSRMRDESIYFLLAEWDGAVVGYSEARLTRYGAHIGRLAVDPRVQGRGIGQRLLRETLTWLWQREVAQVTLNTQETNRASRQLYQRLGFHPVGRRITVWERGL
jgi:ribosomal-protein-alanine N-acetyltransferase